MKTGTYKTTQHTIHQLSLQTIKALVIMMVFAGVTFLLAGNAASSVEQSISQYEETSNIFKILEN